MLNSAIPRRAVLRGGAAALAGLAATPVNFSALAQESEAGSLDPAERRAVELIEAAAEPLPDIAAPGFAAFIDRFAEAKVILLGESSHGTDEFYRARAAITERLVREHGFTIVAVEADWPDAARIDAYIRGRTDLPSALTPFQRFPIWMWRNRAVRDFVDRLHEINAGIAERDRKVGFYGLDLYSLPSSMDAVVDFVTRFDPQALKDVHKRYGCLAPFKDSPETYGALARGSAVDTCSEDVLSVVDEVLKERMNYIEGNDAALFHAVQNARVVAASEAYYRAMYEGSVASWNLRDTHMFQTLQAVLEARGPDARAVVLAHNSHIGDAAATDMGATGEINIGHLCRREYGDDAVLVGFGTHHGTVTAASEWGGPTETKKVRPSIPESWGALMREAAPDRFVLDLRNAAGPLEAVLRPRRQERFIGVIYRPESERVSHYAGASLADQFDAFVWFEVTKAVEPLPTAEIEAMPRTYPFAM
jgi:erythromycin esterase-like protein